MAFSNEGHGRQPLCEETAAELGSCSSRQGAGYSTQLVGEFAIVSGRGAQAKSLTPRAFYCNAVPDIQFLTAAESISKTSISNKHIASYTAREPGHRPTPTTLSFLEIPGVMEIPDCWRDSAFPFPGLNSRSDAVSDSPIKSEPM